MMQAKDVMTAPAVTAGRDTPVEQIVELLLERRISAVPIVDAGGRLEGILSEGDLMRRVDGGRERRGSWWLALVSLRDEEPAAYRKLHGRRAGDVMTPEVVTVDESAPVERIAALLEKHRIKRVPVVRDGRVVGIVSRANLLHGLAARPPEPAAPATDTQLRDRVVAELQKAGIDPTFVNVVVRDGTVSLWGTASGAVERDSASLAARNAGGQAVENHLAVMVGMTRALMWE